VQHPEALSVQYLSQLHEEKFLLNFVSEKLKEVRELCSESDRQTDRQTERCGDVSEKPEGMGVERPVRGR
jgi:hypothetical protein